MDDLLDLDWGKSGSPSTANGAAKPPQTSRTAHSSNNNGTSSYNFDALTRSMPTGTSASGPRSSAKAATPTSAKPPQAVSSSSDAFSSLLDFSASGSTTPQTSMTMAQRQQQQGAGSRASPAPPGSKAQNDTWGSTSGWDAFETSSSSSSSKSTPSAQGQKAQPISSAARDPFDFNDFAERDPRPQRHPPIPKRPAQKQKDPFDFSDFEDPGESQSSALGGDNSEQEQTRRVHRTDLLDDSYSHDQHKGNDDDDDDDFLGALGKPVEPRKEQAQRQPPPRRAKPATTRSASPPPHLLGQIVEMGFSPFEARDALAKTESGLDVEAALEMLLKGSGSNQRQQHEDTDEQYARKLQQADGRDRDVEMEEYEERERQRANARRRPAAAARNPQAPARPTRDAASPSNGDAAAVDFDWQKQADALYSQASEFSANVFTKANAFWSSAKTQAQKALEERNSAAASGAHTPREGGQADSGRSSPASDSVAAARAWARRWGTSKPPPGGASGAPRDGRPRWMVEAEEQADATESKDTASGRGQGADGASAAGAFKDSDNEDEPAPPFIPPAARKARSEAIEEPLPPRPSERKRAVPTAPAETMAPTSEAPSAPAPRAARPAATTARRSAPAPAKKDRVVIPEDLAPVGRSAQHKETGNAAFKKGAYGEAEAAYTAALEQLAEGSLRRVPLLNNRANARIKNGDASGASRDCTTVLQLIVSADAATSSGVALYQASLENPLPSSLAAEVNLRDAYGKSLSRRAQAYEMLERWLPALKDWTLLERYEKEQGSGASVGFRNLKSAQDGIKRCKGMVSGNKGEKPPSTAAGTPAARRATGSRTAASRAASSAVALAEEAGRERVRAATAAQQAEEAAAHSLKDSIDAKVNDWKAGKETNIRALLASLENVVWPELGWKKVGMHEVITDPQVKKQYTKAMVKLHPDKLTPKTTALEHRLVGSAVFAVLNEAFVAHSGGK